MDAFGKQRGRNPPLHSPHDRRIYPGIDGEKTDDEQEEDLHLLDGDRVRKQKSMREINVPYKNGEIVIE